MEPRHIIGAAIALSVVAHLALVASVFLADARPFEPVAADHVAVDIVTPQQLADAEKQIEKQAEQVPPPEPPQKQPEPFRLPDLTIKPTLDEAKTASQAASHATSQAAQPAPPPKPSAAPAAPAQKQAAAPAQPPAPASPPASSPPPVPSPPPPMPAAPSPPPHQQLALQSAPAPAPEPVPTPEPTSMSMSMPPPGPAAPPQPEADLTVKYGVSLGLPDAFGGAAWEKADLAKTDIAAFRRHLKSCSRLPAALAPGDDARVKLRASFTPQGRLMGEPVVIEVRRPAKAVLLMQAAKQALEACQPYAMLPADKYDEWKVLDLEFTPQDFGS